MKTKESDKATEKQQQQQQQNQKKKWKFWWGFDIVMPVGGIDWSE